MDGIAATTVILLIMLAGYFALFICFWISCYILLHVFCGKHLSAESSPNGDHRKSRLRPHELHGVSGGNIDSEYGNNDYDDNGQ